MYRMEFQSLLYVGYGRPTGRFLEKRTDDGTWSVFTRNVLVVGVNVPMLCLARAEK